MLHSYLMQSETRKSKSPAQNTQVFLIPTRLLRGEWEGCNGIFVGARCSSLLTLDESSSSVCKCLYLS